MCQGSAPHGLLREDQDLEELSSAGLLRLERTLAGPAQENAADARIVDILSADDFQGPRFQTATARWMGYGWRTISKWTNSGEILARARQAGRPVPAHMTTPDWDADDRAEVATDTVIAGLDLFLEHGLVRGKWTPADGASLTTYFVGASIRSLRPVLQPLVPHHAKRAS
jgi:hypothetical protein